MKRVLAVLALLLLPHMAQAKGLVTWERFYDENDPDNSVRANERMLLTWNKATARLGMRDGVEYDLVNPATLKTTWLGTGVTDRGTYDWTIVLNFCGALSAAAGRQSTTIYADSLTRTDRAPTIPVLMVGGNGEANTTVAETWMSDSPACTTGVKSGKSWGQITGVSKGMSVDGTNVFLPAAHTGGVEANGTPPAGGLRKLLGAHMLVNLVQFNDAAINSPRNYCGQCDSILASQTTDTLIVWERPMAHKNGAASILFVNALGASMCGDSLSQTVGCEGDVVTLMVALARLDSLTGRGVFNASALPIKLGLTVHGGLTSGAARYSGGLYLPDSAAFKASMQDSIGDRRIPMVIGVDWMNLRDSSSTITAAQKKWLADIPLAKFTPQVAPRAGNASWENPLDPFGYERARVFYSGEDCNTGGDADTCMYCLLASNKFHLDSIPEFRGRVSGFAMPYLDDWSPSGMTAADVDSALWVIRKVFPGGILVDAQSKKADPALSNPLGWFNYQRREHIGIDGSSINLLAHSGSMISGTRLLADFRADSTAPYAIGCCNGSTGRMPIPQREVTRAWNMLFGMGRDYDVMPYDANATGDFYDGVNTPIEDYLYGTRPGSVLKFHVNDFAAGTDPPRRPAWWAIKSIDNAMRVINSFGTTVVKWDYPDRIDP